jgi:hypothetical protein
MTQNKEKEEKNAFFSRFRFLAKKAQIEGKS